MNDQKYLTSHKVDMHLAAAKGARHESPDRCWLLLIIPQISQEP
jgi:hypothetical protein